MFASRNCVFTQSEEKREQEVRSLKSINDSFRKFVITEDFSRLEKPKPSVSPPWRLSVKP